MHAKLGLLLLPLLLWPAPGAGSVVAAKSLKKLGQQTPSQRKLKILPIKIDFPELRAPPSKPQTLRQMRRRVRRFNRLVDTDRFMEHLGAPGTYLDLGGRFPPYKIRARLCSTPTTGVPNRIVIIICRRFKNRHLFWKKMSTTRRRKLAAVESYSKSKAYFERKLLEVEAVRSVPQTPPLKKARFRRQVTKRVLSSTPSRKKQLKLVRKFVQGPKRRSLMMPAAPAKHAINFDDSRLVVHMFAKLPPRQPQFVRPTNDGENVVVQPRIQLHH